MTPDDLRAEGWTTAPSDGDFGDYVPLWRRDEDGAPVYALWTEPRHANLRGKVQGGLLMTAADRAMGLTAWAAMDGRPSATIGFNANFVSAGEIGRLLTIRPRVVRATRSLVFMEGAIQDGDRPVLSATGVWKLSAEAR